MLQYFLDDFWNFVNLVKIWTRRPTNYYQITPKYTRKIWEHPWKIWISDIWESENLQISKCRIFNSSKFRSSKIEKWGTQDFRKHRDSQILRYPKSIFFKDVPTFFLVFFEVNSWQIRGSRVHYGSKKSQNFRSSKIHPKSIGIDQESIFSHFGIIKTPFWH